MASSPVALLAELEATRDRIPVDDVPNIIGRLAGLQAALWARLVTPPSGVTRLGDPVTSPAPDRLLTAKEAATRLGVSRDWLYANARRLPFAFQLGARRWKFNEAGMLAWMQGGRR